MMYCREFELRTPPTRTYGREKKTLGILSSGCLPGTCLNFRVFRCFLCWFFIGFSLVGIDLNMIFKRTEFIVDCLLLSYDTVWCASFMGASQGTASTSNNYFGTDEYV